MRTRLFAVVVITTFAAIVTSLLHVAVAARDRRATRRSSRDARWPETADQHHHHHHQHHNYHPQPLDAIAIATNNTTTTTTQGPPEPQITTGRQSSSSDQYRTLSSLLAASASEGSGAAANHHDLDGDHDGARRQHHQHRQHQWLQQHQRLQQHQLVADDASAGAADDDIYPETMPTAPSSYGRETVRGGAWTADDKPWRPTTDYFTGDDDRPTPPPRWSTQRLLNPSQNFGSATTAMFASNRQLKKYGPLLVETEMTTGGGGGGGGGGGSGGGNAAVYDSATGYSNHAVAYDATDNGFYNRQPVEGLAGWYGGETLAQVARPTAEAVTRPAPVAASKTSFDVQKLSALALVKIGLAKVKLLAAIKFLALLAVKLKALTLLKVLLLAKFAAASKLFNLLVLPFVPNLLLWLRNATLFQLNPAAANAMQQQMMASSSLSETASATTQGGRNDSAPIERVVAAERRAAAADLDYGPSSLATTAALFRYVATARSAECVERLACRVAGTKPLSFQSVWVDWILSSMANYIPNEKLKSYMSTFKDVSDYRLEKIFTQPSTAEWLKWCDDRYYCEEDSMNDNII